MNWSNERPTNPGTYWFYGDPFSDRTVNNEYIDVYLVKIRKGSNCLIFIAEGNFMDNKKGMWMPAELPEIPS